MTICKLLYYFITKVNVSLYSVGSSQCLASFSPLLITRHIRKKVKRKTSPAVTEVTSPVCPEKCQCLSPTLTCGSREVLGPSWRDWPEKSYETSLKTFLNMLPSTSMLFSNKEKVTATFYVITRQLPLTAVK